MWTAHSFVIATTAVLFILWSRYVCAALLAAQTPIDSRDEVARANSLRFAEVLRALEEDGPQTIGQLDEFADALGRDFEVVTYLIRHMGSSSISDTPIEAWMLRVDYRIQAAWFKVMRPISDVWARRKVNQMALIVCHFADLIGERATSPT